MQKYERVHNTQTTGALNFHLRREFAKYRLKKMTELVFCSMILPIMPFFQRQNQNTVHRSLTTKTRRKRTTTRKREFSLLTSARRRWKERLDLTYLEAAVPQFNP